MASGIRVVVVCIVLIAESSGPLRAGQRPSPTPVAVIPFELVGQHIFVKASINGSRPLAFQFDTGLDRALVSSNVANELRLRKKGTVLVGGAGAQRLVGNLLSDATWSLAGLRGFTQPVTVSLPLQDLSAAIGREIDGAIGGEFIRRFVITVDYEARTLTLYDPKAFKYRGGGETLPIELTRDNRPVMAVVVTPVGGQALARQFMFDLGSADALVLNSPFVSQERLLDRGMKTIRSIGQTGVGGKTDGEIGRLASVQLGSFVFNDVVAMFSKDKAGILAEASLAGNIGGKIANRFCVTLDYRSKRIILEPAAAFSEVFDPAYSGLALLASGPGYHVLHVTEVLEDSPATDAGIQVGDIITAIDSTPASALTLSEARMLFQKPVSYLLSLKRGLQTLTVRLTPKRLIQP